MKRRNKHGVAWVLAILLLALVLFYVFLSRIVLHYVNNTLEKGLYGYSGHIGDLDLALLHGGYRIENVEIFKVDAGKETPFFSADRVRFTLLWKALLRGELSGEVEIDGPEILFIHGSNETESQGGEEGDWLQVIRDLTPFTLGRGEVRNGIIIFRNTRGDDVEEILLTDLFIVAENLSNYQNAPGNVVGGMRAQGLFAGQAPVEASISIDPMSEDLYLDANFRIQKLSLLQLMPITRSYANFDFERGEADIAAEIAVKGNKIRGYIKPVLTDIIVGRFQGDITEDRDGPIIFLWENLVGLFTFLLQEKSIERFATIIPVTGTVENPDVDVWEAIGNAFENAYGKSIAGGLENNTDLEAGFEENPEAYLQKLERAVDHNHESQRSPDDADQDNEKGRERGPPLPHRDDESPRPPNRPV